MYTVPNIRAGGTTRAAGVTFSVFLLALLLGLGPYVESIPLAVLAAILIKVGWDLSTGTSSPGFTASGAITSWSC